MGFFAFIMAIVFGILALIGGLQWLEVRGRTVEPTSVPPQLDRMESALASLEARLDDLQEQQRFLERLLAERPERPALSSGEDGDADADAGSILFDTDAADGGGR